MNSQVMVAKPSSAKVAPPTAARVSQSAMSNERGRPGGIHPGFDFGRMSWSAPERPSRSFPGALQRKLLVGSTHDPLEHEADRVADQVVRSATAAPAMSVGGHGLVARKCAACECAACKRDRDEQVGKISRQHTGGSTSINEAVAPAIVQDVLRSPGQPLDSATRSFFEPRFGHDFSRVRIHVGGQAAQSARSVKARAYTANSHIVFGEGEFRPDDAGGRRLLAHELTHTIQQSASPRIRRSAAASEDGVVPVSGRDAGARLRRAMETCADLMDPRVVEKVRIPEKAVQGGLAAEMPGSIRELPLPDGSSTHLRPDKPYDPSKPGTGTGYIDISLKHPPMLEIMEVKHADSAVEGLDQLANYIEKGNSEANADWRSKLGISTVVPMPTSRFPGRQVRATGSGEPVTVRWCTPGFLIYKAIREQDRDIFVCTQKDQGKIDAFLKFGLDRGRNAVDEYINKTVGPKIEAAIKSMPLGDVIAKLIANPAGRAMLRKVLPGLDPILDKLDAKALGDLVEKAISPLAEQIRAVAMEFKAKLLDAVRDQIRNRMLDLLQAELTALCAALAAVTMSELLKSLQGKLPKIFGEAVADLGPPIAASMALVALAEVAEDVLKAVVVVCGAVLGVLAALEIAAALAALEIGAALQAAIAAIVRALAPAVPAFAAADGPGMGRPADSAVAAGDASRTSGPLAGAAA